MHVTFGLTKALDKDEAGSLLYCAPGVQRKMSKRLAAGSAITLLFKSTKQSHKLFNVAINIRKHVYIKLVFGVPLLCCL